MSAASRIENRSLRGPCPPNPIESARRLLGRPGVRLGLCMVVLTACAAARVDACTLSPTGVSFGVYNVYSTTPLDSTGSIMVQCPSNARNVRVTLSSGSSGTYTARTLRQGSNQMLYNLYRDAALTSVWGDGTGGTGFFFASNWQGKDQGIVQLPIYGRVPAQQDVGAGTYGDTVVVTIDF